MEETPNCWLRINMGDFVDGLILKKLANGSTPHELDFNWWPKGMPSREGFKYADYEGQHEWVPVASIHFYDEQVKRLSELNKAGSGEGNTRLDFLEALECV